MKKVKWYIRGHLIWKTRAGWRKLLNEKCHIYGGDFGMPDRPISAYEFWARYSPIKTSL